MKYSRPVVYLLSRWLSRALLWPFARVRVSGAQHMAAHRRACLIAANHISHFDPLLLSFMVERQIDFMGATEFFSPAVAGWWMRSVGTFPINRAGHGAGAMRAAARRLRAGRLVGMFPDGGIRDGKASILEGAPGKVGVKRLATLARVPVVPCVILGTDRLYDAHRWRPWPWGRGRVPVWVGFGPAIMPEEWATPGESRDLLGERLREVYSRLKEEFRLVSADLPASPQRRMAHF